VGLSTYQAADSLKSATDKLVTLLHLTALHQRRGQQIFPAGNTETEIAQ
jgi:hypothetical protein